MKRGPYIVTTAAFAVLLVTSVVQAEVFQVPDAIRGMRTPHEEVHVLRTLADGAAIGEQRFRAEVADDTLALTVVTHFTTGEQWDERAEMDLRTGYRAKAFHKIGRQ